MPRAIRSVLPPPRRAFGRRALLRGFAAAGAGAFLAACGGRDLDPFAPAPGPESPPATEETPAARQDAPAPAAAAAREEPEPEPQAEAAPAPAPEPEPEEALPEPSVFVVPTPVPQGNAALVLLDAPGAATASVAWEGEAFPLSREGSRFFGFIGVDVRSAPGPAPFGIGAWRQDWTQLLWMTTAIQVAPVEWTSDDIKIDAANIALLDPDVRERDIELRRPHQSRLTPVRHWRGTFDPPATGAITALYGERRSFNGGPISDYHSGVDYSGAVGDPITAPNDGVITWTGRTDRRGNGLIIDHGTGVFSGYYHLSEALGAPGSAVARGDVIGYIGATGLATGPHLHWELVVRGVAVDPIPWMRAREVPDPEREPGPAERLNAANQASA